MGNALEKVNALAGENKAYLENLGNQYTREALSTVLEGKGTTLYDETTSAELSRMGSQYRAASAEYEMTGSREAALKMEHLKEAAESLATATYESSEQYQMFHEAELDQIAAIRESIVATNNLTAALNGYELQQEQSKGQGISYDKETVNYSLQAWRTGDYEIPAFNGSGYATGLGRVPYDNFPAILHEGERVLTAREARVQDQGVGGVVVNMGDVTVREDADIDRIAEAFVEKLRLARMAG